MTYREALNKVKRTGMITEAQANTIVNGLTTHNYTEAKSVIRSQLVRLSPTYKKSAIKTLMSAWKDENGNVSPLNPFGQREQSILRHSPELYLHDWWGHCAYGARIAVQDNRGRYFWFVETPWKESGITVYRVK